MACFDSARYWQMRYAAGGDSGAGSAGRLAAFKAQAINQLIRETRLSSAVDLGCGDGRQASLLQIDHYLGLDLSDVALDAARRRLAGRPGFVFARLADAPAPSADLALSLDVLYHLVDPEIWASHLETLFAASRRYAVVYALDHDGPPSRGGHIVPRRFLPWTTANQPDFAVHRYLRNPYAARPEQYDDNCSNCVFVVYRRLSPAGAGAPPRLR